MSNLISDYNYIEYLILMLLTSGLGLSIRYTLGYTKQSWVMTAHHTLTYCLLPTITMTITALISGNLALSLGMIGALSIVRFRNPVKSPLELVLFFALIKKYLSNKLLFIFLALSPTLIMFSFNDLGGYQRLDALSITAILIHALISQKYYEKKIDLNFYQKILFYFIFPFIFISILFHEIQLFSLPFHFFVTWNILKENFFSIVKRYLIFLIPIYLVFFIYPDSESIILMEKNIGERGIYSSAFLFHTKNIGLVHYLNEININILNINNFKMHLLMILLATTPFVLILLYFNKLNLLTSDNEINYKFIFFVTFPYLAGLLIGDFGRWINIMSFTAFGYMSQFPLKGKLNDFKLFSDEIYKFIVNFILLSLTIFYLFFIRIPHCCNLEKLNINLYGGIVNKGISIINVLFNSEEGGLFDLDARFK